MNLIKNQQNFNATEDDYKRYYNLILHPNLFHVVNNLVPCQSIIKIFILGSGLNNTLNTSKNNTENNGEPNEFIVTLRRDVKIKDLIPMEIINQHYILNGIQEFSEHLFLDYLDVIPKLFNVMTIIINKDNQYLYLNKLKYKFCILHNA